MKLVIASDIHGSAFFAQELIEAFEREKADELLLLGDILYHGPRNDFPDDYSPKKVFAMLNAIKEKILCVRGNCDSFSDSALIYSHTIEGVKIFATHGHKYNVKNGLLSFQYAAMEAGAQGALFGHTHVPYCMEQNGLWLMNPGACGGYRASYGLIEIKNDSVSCRIVEGNL